jgi:ATP-binding cassette, subfamily B, bacterial PglK
MFKMLRKFNFILAAPHKRQIVFLLGIILLQAIVETVSIAAILPFLAVLGAPELVESNKILANLYAVMPVSSINQFMILLGGIFFVIIAVGNIFASFAVWYFLRFSMECGYQLSSDLFKKYLLQPYQFFLSHNTSTLITNVFTEVSRVILGILVNLLQMFNKLMMIGFITILLLIVDWKLALSVVSVLGGAYVIAFLIIRKKLQKAGENSSYCNANRHRTAREAFSIIKELKLLGRESYFLACFNHFSKRYVESDTSAQMLPQVSRYFIEIIAFGGILLIVLYLLYTQKDLNQALPLLGLYALAGYRLMPALQQIFACFSTIRYHSHALDIIEKEFKRPTPVIHSEVVPLPFNQCIEFRNISFQYEGAPIPSVQGLELNIIKNSSMGIVGSSGAGKTTLVDLLLGLFLGTEGGIYVDGQKLTEQNLQAWRLNVGYVPQMIRLVDNSIKNNIAIGIPEEKINMDVVRKVAQMAGISEYIENLPDGYETLVGEEGSRLSGGQKQRIGIARALYHDPQVLVLDEATSALDNFSEQVIVEALKALSEHKTIIIIAHRLTTVKHCQKIVFMEKGKITDQGSYTDLFERNKHFYELANSLNS